MFPLHRFNTGFSAGANSCETVLNCLDGSSSGLQAFVGFKDKGCFSTPAVLILRPGISGNGECPLSGTFIFLSWVDTDKNCSFNVSALSLSVVHSFVCVLSFGMTMFFVRINLP